MSMFGMGSYFNLARYARNQELKRQQEEQLRRQQEEARKAQEAADVAAGNGYMSNGTYVAYSAPDRTHVQSANANRNSPYQDISTGSQLNRYYGEKSILGRASRGGLGFASARRFSLLGGFSQLGV